MNCVPDRQLNEPEEKETIFFQETRQKIAHQEKYMSSFFFFSLHLIIHCFAL